MSYSQRTHAQERVETLAGQGMRVVALAHADLYGIPDDRDTAEIGLTYTGLAWFTDPLQRPPRRSPPVCRPWW